MSFVNYQYEIILYKHCMAYALGASADEHCEIIMNDLIIMLRWCQCVGVCMPVSEYLCGIFNDANNLLMLPVFATHSFWIHFYYNLCGVTLRDTFRGIFFLIVFY